MDICDVPVISAVCSTVGKGAATLVAAPFDWLAHAMGQAASWMFTAVWAVFDTTTLVDVTSPGYIGVYNILFGIAVFIMLMFFCLQLITGLIHRDPTALSRAALGLAKSILGSFVLITLTGLLLEITDQLCIGIIQATGNTMASMGDRIGLLVAALTTLNIAAPGVGAIVTIFLAGLAIAAAVIVWFSLLVRKALLLVAIVFGPVALAGLTWDTTKGWFGKWATFVVAMIASKLVVTVIFLVAISQVAAPITPDLASVSDPIAGIVLMFMAAFAPYLAYKFLSFVGFDMYQAMSMEQEAKQSMNRPIPIPNTPQGMPPKKILDGRNNSQSPSSPTPPAAGTAAGAEATGAAGGAGAGAASSGGSGAAAGGAGAGGAGAGAAAAGPAAAVVIGAEVVKAAATAGPKLGGAVGAAGDGQAGAAADQASPPSVSPAGSAPTVLPASNAPAARPSTAPPPSPSPSPRTSPPATGKG